MSGQTLFDEFGGEAVLRPVVERFVDRVFDDTMIGFFFRKANRARVRAMEYEFIARYLGADIEYTGRSIEQAHAAHPIMGGQFMRRLQILKETLDEAGVPPHIRSAWIEHTESLRPLVTHDSGGDCDPAQALARVHEHKTAPRGGRS